MQCSVVCTWFEIVQGIADGRERANGVRRGPGCATLF